MQKPSSNPAATVILASVLLAITGCASTEYAQYSKAQTDIATAKHAADSERYKAFAAIAGQGDATAKVAAVMAMAMGSGQSGGQTTIQAPQASQALQWASILVPGLTQVMGMRYSYLSQQTSSNNATALGISTNSTFAGIAGKIQAPGAITTTTLSGTGNLGSGTYGTADRHDVLNTSPVITPVVQVVPTVIEPVVQVVPTVITPVVQVVPTVIEPVVQVVPTVIEPVVQVVPTVVTPVVQVAPVAQ